MMSALISLLQTLQGFMRSRAALHLEVLALRHQLQVLERSRPKRLRIVKADRCLWAWAVTFVDRVADGARHRQARDRDRVASPGLSFVVDVEESRTNWTTGQSKGALSLT
jgi:hypothetical protein